MKSFKKTFLSISLIAVVLLGSKATINSHTAGPTDPIIDSSSSAERKGPTDPIIDR